MTMKKVACKRDKALTGEGQCPVCKGEQFSQAWKGRLFILTPEKSEIAKRIGISHEGEYAIKVT